MEKTRDKKSLHPEVKEFIIENLNLGAKKLEILSSEIDGIEDSEAADVLITKGMSEVLSRGYLAGWACHMKVEKFLDKQIVC